MERYGDFNVNVLEFMSPLTVTNYSYFIESINLSNIPTVVIIKLRFIIYCTFTIETCNELIKLIIHPCVHAHFTKAKYHIRQREIPIRLNSERVQAQMRKKKPL